MGRYGRLLFYYLLNGGEFLVPGGLQQLKQYRLGAGEVDPLGFHSFQADDIVEGGPGGDAGV